MFADVQTFGLFLFGDADAAEEGADDLPGDEAGDHSPDGVGSSTQSLDAELLDAAADQQAYASACEETFAMVGSMSAFDSGGAGTAQGCGLPDIRSAARPIAARQLGYLPAPLCRPDQTPL